MTRYTFLANLPTPHNIVGIWLLMEMYRRIGKPTAELTQACFSESGYCIDAPDVIPAGGCFHEQITAKEDIPSQITWSRNEHEPQR